MAKGKEKNCPSENRIASAREKKKINLRKKQGVTNTTDHPARRQTLSPREKMVGGHSMAIGGRRGRFFTCGGIQIKNTGILLSGKNGGETDRTKSWLGRWPIEKIIALFQGSNMRELKGGKAPP